MINKNNSWLAKDLDEEALYRHPQLKKVLRSLHRERRQKIVASFALLAFGLGFAYACFGGNLMLSAFGLICAVLGIRFVFLLLASRTTEAGRLMRLLQHQPKQIVWVYSVVTERLPFGFQVGRYGTLYFKLADGDDIAVSLPVRDLKGVSEFLNRLLPHASFGYTRDREQWYMASPLMLLQDEEEGN